MKARLLIIFVLILGLALPLAQSTAAQGPLPDKPKTINPRPPGNPLERRANRRSHPLPRAASSLSGAAGHALDRQALGKSQPFAHAASSSGGVSAQEVSAAVTLGLPGTAYRYAERFGETEVAYFDNQDGAQLAYPFGVGVDGIDNLWVGEILGARAVNYDTSDGSPLMSLGTAGLIGEADETHFYGVADVATDGDGDVWVVDREPARVVEYDGSSGDYLGQMGVTWNSGTDENHFDGPQSVAFDSDGYIYVSDGDNHRIQIFDNTGAYYGTLGTGSPGTGIGEFDSPRHITIDDYDYMYIADAGNHRVQIISIEIDSENHDHTYWYEWTLGVTGESGSDDDHFNWPIGVVPYADYIYVADQNNHRVQVFEWNWDTLTYDCVHTIGGTAGSGDYQFRWPSDVAVDSAGYLYVADQGNMRVQEFEEFDGDWTYVQTFGTTGVPYLTDAYHYNEPYGVAVDAAGNLGIVEDEGRGHRFIKLPSVGTPLVIGEAGVGGSDNLHLEDPNAVAFDSSGNIYVADSGNNRVQIFHSNGAYWTTLGTGWGTGPTQFKYPDGIAVGSNGTIYVSDRDNHRVQIYNSSRTYVATIGQTGTAGTGNNQLDWPAGVAVDGSGAIYVADAGNHRVQKFNSSRAWVMTLGVADVSGGDFDHFDAPSDVAVDAAGRIFVADRFNQRVQVFSAAGAYLTTIGNAWGGTTGRFREPTGVEVDNAGNVYVADHHNQRIQKFAFGVPGWRQSNLNGFGNRQNVDVLSLAPFSGSLYAGTYNPNSGTGAQLWRLAGGSWAPVLTNGLNDAANVGIDHLIEFKNNLYAGTWNQTDGGQVQRSSNGTTWIPVASQGFGDRTNGEVFRFAVFSDTLYASTWSYTSTHGAGIWRSSTGDSGSWAPVVSNGFDVNPNNKAVTAMGVFNGYLYAGTDNWNSATITSTGAEVWRSDTGNAGDWEKVNTDGFGTPNNVGISALAVFSGSLYASTVTAEGVGAEVWRCQVCNNSDWQKVVDNGFSDSTTGDLSALEVYDGQLYFIVGNATTGLEISRSDTGDSGDWEQVGFSGLGDSNDRAPYWDNSVAVFNDNLFLGTVNGANGGEVWAFLNLDQSVYLPILLKDR